MLNSNFMIKYKSQSQFQAGGLEMKAEKYIIIKEQKPISRNFAFLPVP